MDHQPHDYQAQEASGVDLVLSGHTHGGQMIPFNRMGEWLGLDDKIYGMEKRGDTSFIVTSGISDWAIKFKTGCKSEYVVIDVQGAEADYGTVPEGDAAYGAVPESEAVPEAEAKAETAPKAEATSEVETRTGSV